LKCKNRKGHGSGKARKTIEELFEGYEGDYEYEEIDWGEPVGAEILDPFYSEKNQAELSHRIADIEAGRNLTFHELIEVEYE